MNIHNLDPLHLLSFFIIVADIVPLHFISLISVANYMRKLVH